MGTTELVHPTHADIEYVRYGTLLALFRTGVGQNPRFLCFYFLRPLAVIFTPACDLPPPPTVQLYVWNYKDCSGAAADGVRERRNLSTRHATIGCTLCDPPCFISDGGGGQNPRFLCFFFFVLLAVIFTPRPVMARSGCVRRIHIQQSTAHDILFN